VNWSMLGCAVPVAPYGDMSDFHYHIAGAIAIFRRMDIGTLDVDDFLGKPLTLFNMTYP
jgi:hypothetical protein